MRVMIALAVTDRGIGSVSAVRGAVSLADGLAREAKYFWGSGIVETLYSYSSALAATLRSTAALAQYSRCWSTSKGALFILHSVARRCSQARSD